MIYSILTKNSLKINKLIEIIGRSSYEIYLFQMAYFATCAYVFQNITNDIDNYYISIPIFIFSSTLICVAIPVLFSLLQKKIITRTKIL